MKDKLRMFAILVTLIVTIVLGIYILGASGYLAPTNASAASVQNVFVDIDGDGQLDLLVKGEVIYNNPLASQPLSSP